MSGYVTTNPTYYNMKHDRKNQRPTHQTPRHKNQARAVDKKHYPCGFSWHLD